MYWNQLEIWKPNSGDVGQWLSNVVAAEEKNSQMGCARRVLLEWWDVTKEANVHYNKSPANAFLYKKIKKKGDRDHYYSMRLREDVKDYTPVAEKRKLSTIIRKVDTVDMNDEITRRVVEEYGEGYGDTNKISEDFEVVKKIVELYDNMRRNALVNINYWTNGETVEYDDGKEVKDLVAKNPRKKRRSCSGKQEMKLYPYQPIQSNEYEKKHYPTKKQFEERFYELTKETLSQIPNAKEFDDMEFLCDTIIEKKKDAHNESRASWIMKCLKKDL